MEKMAEFRIDLGRQGLFKAVNLFGNFAEAFGVVVGIGAALLVADDSEALAESGGEIGEGGVHRKSLKRGGLWRKRRL